MIKLGIKISLCAFLIVPLLAAPLSSNVSAEENSNVQAAQDIVNIPDLAFKSYLNSLLSQPSTSDITEAQMDTITNITINGGTVADITGIDYAHNLTSVRLANTQVTDFSLLASLSKLTNISLAGSNITSNSIPDLNGLQELTNLNISPANLTNDALTKINKIPNLTYLNLDSNHSLTDIMPLKSLPNLVTLFVQFCGINDYRGIEDFPSLKNLSAYGQNVGRTVLINSSIKSSALNYDEANQTIFVPFTLMTERTVNFNGDLIPFSTSTSGSSTYFTLNEQQITGSRLSIDDTGITVSGITKDDFDAITKMEYNAVYNNPAGSYAAPPNITSYTISGGTYDHYFDIDHSLTITNDDTISYREGNPVTEAQFLSDIHAETDDGTPVTSDFDSVVDLSMPGVYTVTLNAENAAGLKATPKTVTVTVLAKPIITADKTITYTTGDSKTSEQFLKDISATTNDGSPVTNDFDSVVNLNKSGTYEVTLRAVSADGIEADPVKVLVTVENREEPPGPPTPPTPPGPDPTPTPDSSPNPDGSNDSSANNGTTSPNHQNSTNQASLPATGDSNLDTMILIGIVLAGVTVFSFRKRKQH
ncbi:LapB repeat-containing protein [Listeria ivanovii]|uniref:Internalin protein, putative peptidoglycan bound protein (LPXTG motif) n=1 Tax=Listeria ivanovii (strain ATCC BAA-678 / PAM 55) TaxID=881621 RepID=G2ZCE4_LISIP|nr:LapB repeat-containing protein [Listeria ivanovii]MCJ1716655.1 LapB repeat-containing protein [Listeria ivanovii]MCJ1721437.1 LapB repeat-containing protein [Listeria ivanovii]MCJ1734547.1 LapB repeat-containing protein [Listeria ivanovii]PZG40679.1 internalin [Listeria ivanovii]CBW85018.1 Internalin protein, putative peptidoglycan bound protein (LPXTG motif) [Listeria ivanovii subsp. ivanovii PAM 55]